MRELLLQETIDFLNAKGFSVTSFLHSNSCFDIAARKPGVSFLIKVFSNIDALRKDSALELRRLSSIFNTVPVIIGEKSKVFSLKDNVVYDRYGINTVSLNTFRDFIDNAFPSAKYYKGRTSVELDSDKLKEERKRMHLTLEDLASEVGVAKESLHRLEKGNPTSLENAKKLESVLHCKLIKEIDILNHVNNFNPIENEMDLHDPALERLNDLGLKLSVFDHSPFRAANAFKESLLIEKGNKLDIKKKALILEKIKTVFDSGSLIVTKEYKYKNIGSTPIIEEEELHSLGKYNDLFKVIRERKEKQKNGSDF